MKRLRLILLNAGYRTHMYPLLTPPVGLLALAAYVRTKFPVDILILNQRLDNTPTEKLVEQAAAFDPDIVGISCLTTSAHMLMGLTDKLRAALGSKLLVLGGAHATSVGADALHECGADVAVIGEGEITFERVIEAWFNGSDFSSIPGLVWRDTTGEVIHNPGAAPPAALDDLPFLAYDLIDMRRYWRRQSIAPIPLRRYMSLMSSRGCPYQCFWCHSIYGKTIRMASAERVVEEIQHLSTQYGVRDFEFFDDNFNFSEKRVLEFCALIQQRNMNLEIAFPTGVRGDRMTRDMANALADAGMYLCCFALDTGSPRLQEYSGKRLNIDLFLKGLQAVADRRVYRPGFFMMGFPTETEAELQQTIDMACRPEFSTAAFYTVTPFPGTVLYEMLKKTSPEKLSRINYRDADLSGIGINLTDLPDDVFFAYQRKGLRRFFLDPGRIARLLRDHPKPHLLPAYIPIFLYRATKGSLWGKDQTTGAC